MSISLFGVIWFLILIWTLTKNIKYTVNMVLVGSVLQANAMITTGSAYVDVLLFTCIFLCGRFFLLKRGSNKLKISKIDMWLIFLFIIIVVISVISTHSFKGMTIIDQALSGGHAVYSQYDGSTSLYRFLIIFFYMLTFIVLENIGSQYTEQDLVKSFEIMVFLVVFVGGWQWLETNRIIPKTPFLHLFVYSDTSSMGMYYYIATDDIRTRVFSTFREPSYFGAFVATAIWGICMLQNKKLYKYVTFLIAELVLSYSSTGIVAFGIGIILFLFLTKRYKPLKYIFLTIAVGCVIITCFQLWGKIYNATFTKVATIDGNVRRDWDQAALKNMIETKGLGIGYKTVRGSSLFYSLLGQIGIVGTSVFSIIIGKIILKLRKMKDRKANMAVIMLLVEVVAQCIACPDLDFVVLWGILFINALILGGCGKKVA